MLRCIGRGLRARPRRSLRPGRGLRRARSADACQESCHTQYWPSRTVQHGGGERAIGSALCRPRATGVSAVLVSPRERAPSRSDRPISPNSHFRPRNGDFRTGCPPVLDLRAVLLISALRTDSSPTGGGVLGKPTLRCRLEGSVIQDSKGVMLALFGRPLHRAAPCGLPA